MRSLSHPVIAAFAILILLLSGCSKEESAFPEYEKVRPEGYGDSSGGFAVALKLSGPVLKAGETFLLYITLKNIGDKPVEVPGYDELRERLLIRFASGTEERTYKLVPDEFFEDGPKELSPGSTIAFAVDISGPGKINVSAVDGEVDALPAEGEWIVDVSFALPVVGGGTAALTSNPCKLAAKN